MGFSLGTAEGRIIVDGSAAEKGFAVAGAAADSMFSVIKGKIDSVKTLGENLTKIGAVGAAGFGLAVNSAANFEQRMSAIQAVSGATADEFEQLRGKALQLGKDTAYGATDAASAIEELVKAGLSIPDVMNGAADATVNLAAAGEIALPQAAEIASAAMNNFNLAGQDMPRIADLIAGAANASAISVSEFGQSLTQVGAVANLTGMSFDDVAVAVAEMGNAGIKGSDAGTSLKTMLMNLQPATEAQANEFERLGLLSTSTEGALKAMAEQGIKPIGTSMEDIRGAVSDYIADTQGISDNTKEMGDAVDKWLMQNGGMQNAFFTTEGKVKSLAEIQQVLADTTGDMTEQQKLASLELLFGADAIRAAAVMSKEGAAGYNELYASMQKVTAAEVAATKMDNLKGAIEQLKGSFETVAIEVGSVLLPALTWITNKITELVGKFLELPEPVKKAIYILAAIATALSLVSGALILAAFAVAPVIASFLGMLALKSVLSIFTAFSGALMSGLGPIAAFMAAGTRIGVLFGRLRIIVTLLVGALRLMGAAWAIATGPIGIAVAVIAALTAAFVALYRNNEGFRAFIDGIASSVRDFLQPAIDGAKGAIQALVDGFNGVSGSGSGLAQFFQIVGGIARAFWDGLMALWAWFKGNFIPVFQEASSSIMSTLGPALTQIKDVVLTQLWPALQSLWSTLQNELGPVFGFVADHAWILLAVLAGPIVIALAAVAAAVLAVVAVLAIIIPPLVAFGAAIINTIINVVTPVVQGLVGLFTGVFGILQGLVQVFIGIFTGDWSKAWEGLKQMAQSGWDAIVAVFMTVMDVIPALISGLVDAIIALFTTLWDVLVGHSIVPDTIELIIEWFLKLPGAILGMLAGFIADIISKFGELGSQVVGKVTAFIGEVILKFASMAIQVVAKVVQLIADVVQWFAGLPAKVISAVSALASLLQAAGAAWIGGAIRGVSGAIGGLLGLFSGLGSRILGAMGNVSNILVGAGRSIINGLISGINSAIGGVRSALGRVTSMIPSWKGPPKTDAKLLVNAGKLIMGGLRDGIALETPALKKQLQSLMPMMQQSVSMEGTYRPATTAVTVAAPAAVDSGAKQFTFNSYGNDSKEASDKTARRVRALAAMGAF